MGRYAAASAQKHILKRTKVARALEDISRVKVTADPVPDVLLALCEYADSPRSLAVWLAYKHGSYHDLVSMESNPLDYEPRFHRNTFALDHACTSLLSKYQNFDLGIDRTDVAFQKWKASEVRCASLNSLMRKRWGGKDTSCFFPSQVEQVLSLARSKIASILGSVDYEYIRSQCHFGPGSDLDTKGDNTTTYHKFATNGAISPGCIPLYDDIFSNDDADIRGEYAHHARLCDTSRLSFVSKNAKTDRAICIEPRWNIYLQLGIGALITKRLRRIGIDISKQTNNQLAAMRAYADCLATIDLSSASDSISTNLVIDLLAECDEGWLDLLLGSRCHYTSYDGQRYRLEKISSMGNGYTFPLETLIFYVIAHSAMIVSGDRSRVSRDLWVYGDDIIVPQTSAPLVLEALEHFGFSPNRKKTFTQGYFYESCGKDFYQGENCRPFFIKKSVVTVADAYVLSNQLAAFSLLDGSIPRFASRKVWNIREHVVRRIPRHLRCFGPPEAGNGVIHSTFDVARPGFVNHFRGLTDRGWEGYWINGFVAQSAKQPGWNPYGHLYSKLSADLDSGQGFTPRSSVVWRRKVVYVPTYTDTILI